MILWISLQLAVLLIANVLRLDRHAFTIVITIQVVGAALLSPIMFRNWSRGICAMLASLPFAHLAAVLSATPMREAQVIGLSLEMWLVSLLLFARLARTDFSRAVLAASASALSIGAAILVYVRSEFGAPVDVRVLSALRWMMLSTLLVIGVILAVTTRYVSKRQLIHRQN